jgi:hypothetical protein
MPRLRVLVVAFLLGFSSSLGASAACERNRIFWVTVENKRTLSFYATPDVLDRVPPVSVPRTKPDLGFDDAQNLALYALERAGTHPSSLQLSSGGLGLTCVPGKYLWHFLYLNSDFPETDGRHYVAIGVLLDGTVIWPKESP